MNKKTSLQILLKYSISFFFLSSLGIRFWIISKTICLPFTCISISQSSANRSCWIRHQLYIMINMLFHLVTNKKTKCFAMFTTCCVVGQLPVFFLMFVFLFALPYTYSFSTQILVFFYQCKNQMIIFLFVCCFGFSHKTNA